MIVADPDEGLWSDKSLRYTPPCQLDPNVKSNKAISLKSGDQATFNEIVIDDVKRLAIQLESYEPSSSQKGLRTFLHAMSGCLYPYSTYEDVTINDQRYKRKPLSELEYSMKFDEAQTSYKLKEKFCGRINGILEGQIDLNPKKSRPIRQRIAIEAGAFYDCVIPQEVESMWGPIPIETLPEGIDNKCKAVTHK